MRKGKMWMNHRDAELCYLLPCERVVQVQVTMAALFYEDRLSLCNFTNRVVRLSSSVGRKSSVKATSIYNVIGNSLG